jgi:hypothetical protein
MTRREKARLRSSFRTNVWSELTNKNFGLKYTMHQEIRADALANLPPPGQGGFRESGIWPFRQQNGIVATRQPSSASNRRRVFHMKSDLAIATLIRSRMTELGLSRGEFAKRLGYKNIAKGIRRVDALCEGDIEGTKQVFDGLPQALETSAETVTRALDQAVREIELAEKRESEARDKIWRENFRPHAIILTERTVPSPIFVAAIIGVEKLLRINLDLTQRPVSFVRRVLDRLPEGVIAFGKPVGFVINYSPDHAVRFDRNGQPIEILDKAVRPATAVLCLGRRPITAGALGLVFGK